MAAHNTNVLLKYGLPVLLVFLVIVAIISKIKLHHEANESYKISDQTTQDNKEENIKKSASSDSAAESLDTLTASLSETKKKIEEITKDNEKLKAQNQNLMQKMEGSNDANHQNLSQQVDALKKQFQAFGKKDYTIQSDNSSQTITTVQDIASSPLTDKLDIFSALHGHGMNDGLKGMHDTNNAKPKPIPYYTIPSNSTAVDDKLMTSLVGRIPIKGVVTDPYPFKIIFSDDTLAASGWRIPHLRQMVVSGFTEGDLNLDSVRGWVTSLTFVFDDGRVFGTTSNNNDIGHFSKENALGYLSDEHGNPFFQGKLITNAPTYLTGNVLLDAGQGAANAYSQAQTTNQTSILGSTTSSVTGSASKYVLGQAGLNAANGAQQWWHDRQENSFDAIYVPSGQKIVVNFAKEIDIDYNPIGRKIDYERVKPFNVQSHLD